MDDERTVNHEKHLHWKQNWCGKHGNHGHLGIRDARALGDCDFLQPVSDMMTDLCMFYSLFVFCG